MAKNIPPERAAEYIKTILLELDHLGGHARLKELFPRAEAKLNLSDYEREPYAKSGFIRWQAIVHFNSISLVKAGYIQKSGGKWHLTELGKAALSKPAEEVRELEGLLRRGGDIGLIVSSGGFTAEVEREIRASTKHIETMDLDRLIELWQQYYDKLREAGKALLPLVQSFFLAPTEE